MTIAVDLGRKAIKQTNKQFSILDYSNCEMASTARSHVEGAVMVFCSTW